MSLRLYLLVDGSRAGLFSRWGRAQRKVHNFIVKNVLMNMGEAMSDEYCSRGYPWCFVISAAALKVNKYYIGSFIIQPGEAGVESLVIIYSAVSSPWLEKNMLAEYPLTFWAARILNNRQKSDFSDKKWKTLFQWVKALKRSYSPFWESFALKKAWSFNTLSQVLLMEGSKEDYGIRINDGVEAMPWKSWPDCIQQEEGIWVWRQSRHRKILDSRRIPLRGAEAKMPEAPF
ncbi:hypothetical protein SRABI13_00738 [Erwinia aphidicola]|uniref:T6SS protein Cts1T n=1 Tax=Erwinia aphidicola TaxID=68334 RepID=UPI000C199007|nr:T6SS protein Cts1T [Erwinia aphidicola]PIJ55115.1 T6SS protein Cts1T [Erwinia sp. OLMDLW33]CAH0160221.1 hypothetical protein SRABI13_00738 [Erwinia aphidicola]